MKRSLETPPNQSNAEMEPAVTVDLSVLRKPIKTSVSGLVEVQKAYENGTDEVSFQIVPVDAEYRRTVFQSPFFATFRHFLLAGPQNAIERM